LPATTSLKNDASTNALRQIIAGTINLLIGWKVVGAKEGLARVGAGAMTVARVLLKNAIKMAPLPYPRLLKWKPWRLPHPERDKGQRKAYY
jgi:hypothetical protein